MDPVTMAAYGTLAQGAGNLIGAFMGGGDSGPDYVDQKNQALDYDRKVIKQKTLGAMDAGIHPLYAMGQTPSLAAPVQVGGARGGVMDALSAAGQGIKDYAELKRLQRENREDREMARDLNQARIAETRASAMERLSRSVLNSREAGAVGQSAAASVVARAAQAANSQQDGVANLGVLGSVRLDPNVTDASVLQDRRGELAEWAIAPQFIKEMGQALRNRAIRNAGAAMAPVTRALKSYSNSQPYRPGKTGRNKGGINR